MIKIKVDPWIRFQHRTSFLNHQILDPKRLITKWETRLLDLDSGYHYYSGDYVHQFQHHLVMASFGFKDLGFRRQYFRLVTRFYSASLANQRAIWRNERSVFIRWANQFNLRHLNLKIVAIEPLVDADHDQAKIWLGGVIKLNHGINFDWRSALVTESHRLRVSTAELVNGEAQRFVKILQATFNHCVPEVHVELVASSVTTTTGLQNRSSVQRTAPVQNSKLSLPVVLPRLRVPSLPMKQGILASLLLEATSQTISADRSHKLPGQAFRLRNSQVPELTNHAPVHEQPYRWGWANKTSAMLIRLSRHPNYILAITLISFVIVILLILIFPFFRI